MAPYIKNRQFCVVLVLMFCCLLWMCNFTESKGISFYLQGDDVIFDEDFTLLVCAYSSDTVSNPNITIKGDAKEPQMIPGRRNDTFIEIFGAFVLTSGNHTFVCTVKSDNNTETSTLYITVLPRKFPYCTSNTSNEVIEGDRVLLSCYVEAGTNQVMWVTNTSNIIQYNTMLVSAKKKKQAVIRPFENETGSIYTCVAPSSERHISECSVGPITVYQGLLLSINPYVNQRFQLSGGESIKFLCSSKPEGAAVKWEILQQDKNVYITIEGRSIHVEVPSDSKFTGVINLTCVGNFGIHTNSKSITLNIMAENSKTNMQMVFFIFGGSSLFLVLIVFLLLVLGCKKFITLRRRVEIYDVKRERRSSRNKHPRKKYPQPEIPGGNGGDNHAFSIENNTEYHEVSKNPGGKEMGLSTCKTDDSDVYACIPGDQRPSHSHQTGQQLYTMANRSYSGGGQCNYDNSWKNNRVMSVVYATPDKFRRIIGKNEDVVGGEKEVAVAKKRTETPPYAIVNKRRLIVIQDDTIDEDKFNNT